MAYDIFISYRRRGGFETAKHLYDLLTKDGYRVSFDIDTASATAISTRSCCAASTSAATSSSS